MTDETDSAFVEIAASAPEVTRAAERLLPLYEDTPAAQDPAPKPSRRSRNTIRALLAVVLVLLVVAGVWFLIRVAVAFGQHGLLPAPK